MDKKHNNLAQPETDQLLDKKKNVASRIDPTDHTGVKMDTATKEVEPK